LIEFSAVDGKKRAFFGSQCLFFLAGLDATDTQWSPLWEAQNWTQRPCLPAKGRGGEDIGEDTCENAQHNRDELAALRASSFSNQTPGPKPHRAAASAPRPLDRGMDNFDLRDQTHTAK
jgi:hypothetical protein